MTKPFTMIVINSTINRSYFWTIFVWSTAPYLNQIDLPCVLSPFRTIPTSSTV